MFLFVMLLPLLEFFPLLNLLSPSSNECVMALMQDEVLAARDLLQKQARELSRVSAQCQAVQASEKRNRLTRMELEVLPEDATAYKAVGRMYVANHSRILYRQKLL